MHPPLHLSSPASSTTTYAATYIQRYVHTLLAATGFHKSSRQAVQVLTEILERYLLLVGSTAQKHGTHAGRTVSAPQDVLRALEDIGTSCQDVRAWLEEDAGDVAGRWIAPGNTLDEHSGDEASTSNAVAGPSSRTLARDGDAPGIASLRHRVRRAKAAYSDDERQRIDFEEIGSPRLRLLEELTVQDMRLATPDLSDGSSDHREDSVKSPVSLTRMDTDDAEAGATLISPAHASQKAGIRSDDGRHSLAAILPPIPGRAEQDPVNARQLGARQDADYENYIEARLRKGQAKSRAAERGEAAREAPELQPLKMQDMAPQSKRLTQDLWHKPVPFATSALATSQSKDDIPSIEGGEGIRIITPRHTDVEALSSVYAFGNDYAELVQEVRNGGKDFLTPHGAAYSRVLDRRRAMAAILADSSKYMPCDTLFGSIGVRPSTLPFQPSSSLLVTAPASTESAPTFTAIEPNGRVSPSTVTLSSALYPACRHRNAGNVATAARVLSGGVNSETYRRTTRLSDPVAITDEQHAERVFQGQPASREQLSEGHSFLKAAVDVLNAEHHGLDKQEGRAGAEDATNVAGKRAGSDDEYLEDDIFDDDDDDYFESSRKSRNKKTKRKSTATSADTAIAVARHRAQNATQERLKVKQGTIVATWDWLARDYTDSQLPAKKFRTSTAGAALGGPSRTSGDASRDDE